MSVFDYASIRQFRNRQMLTAIRVIPHEEILTLGSNPAIVVPAPGPNRVRMLVSMAVVSVKPVDGYEVVGGLEDTLVGNCLSVVDTVPVHNLLNSVPTGPGVVKTQMVAMLPPLAFESAIVVQMLAAENKPIILYAMHDYFGGAPENKLIVTTEYYDSSIV